MLHMVDVQCAGDLIPPQVGFAGFYIDQRTSFYRFYMISALACEQTQVGGGSVGGCE